MRTRATAAAAALALVPLAATAAPAQAAPTAQTAGSCSISVPSKVSIYQPYRTITAKFSAGCLYYAESAWWDIVHPSQGYTGAFHYDGSSSSDSQDWYDWEPMGRYSIRPDGAWDSNWDDMAQNSRTMDIRLGARMSASSSRSGKYVTLSGKATRYSPGAQTFRPWANAKVSLRKKACSSCTWRYVKSATTNRYGQVKVKTYSSKAAYWRIATIDTSNTWGRSSATMKR